MIRKFVEARTESLGLMPLIEKLKQIDTPDELKSTSVKAVVGLAERLTGDTIDRILASPEAAKVIKELNGIANGIDKILTTFNEVVTKALNAQGRFELSYAYQRVREGHKLIDVHIHVDHPDEALRHKAHELYRNATRGKFDDVLKNDNATIVRVSSAAFTDSLKKVGKLKVSVFGWDYKEVKTSLRRSTGPWKKSPRDSSPCMASRSKEKRLRTRAIARQRWGICSKSSARSRVRLRLRSHSANKPSMHSRTSNRHKVNSTTESSTSSPALTSCSRISHSPTHSDYSTPHVPTI